MAATASATVGAVPAVRKDGRLMKIFMPMRWLPERRGRLPQQFKLQIKSF